MSIDIRASIRAALDSDAGYLLGTNDNVQALEDAIMEQIITDLGRSTPHPDVLTLDAIYAKHPRFDAGKLFLPEGASISGSAADGTKVTSRDGEDITDAVLGKPAGWDVAPSRMEPATLRLSVFAPGWSGITAVQLPIGEDEISIWPAATNAEESRRNMALQHRDVARLLRAAADRQDAAADEAEAGFR